MTDAEQLIAQARAIHAQAMNRSDLADEGAWVARETVNGLPQNNYWAVTATRTPTAKGVGPFMAWKAHTASPSVAGLLTFISTALPQLCDLAEAGLSAAAASPASGHRHRLDEPNPSPPEPSAGWRGIESAPRDGTPILLLGQSPVPGRAEIYHAWWLVQSPSVQRPHWARFPSYLRPTHWQPLPEPPPSAPAKPASGPVGELEEHKALSPLVGQGDGSSVAESASEGLRPFAPDSQRKSEGGEP